MGNEFNAGCFKVRHNEVKNNSFRKRGKTSSELNQQEPKHTIKQCKSFPVIGFSESTQENQTNLPEAKPTE
jgi:hypothetical protein